MSDFINRIASLSPKRLALLALELHTELEALRDAATEPIAIVGLGCRFPGGASSPEEFWDLLRGGVDAVVEVPSDRWDVHRYYDPDPEAPGRMYSRYGAFLDHVDRFDASFFGIAPREAAQMDPQQRLVLEVTWEALERAACAPDRLAGSAAGVFLGVCTYDHSLSQLTDPARIEGYASTGSAPSILSNRVSYLLDLQGPSLTIDTACSSSLVAVHLACSSLQRRECDLALAGGVNLMLSPITTIALCKGRMLAADGRCRTFDAHADGYVRGEGCGMVVLKRLSDALAAGDHVCAVIRGSAVNQDGHGNGLTAPNLLAQQAVIRRALQDAGVRPGQVGYIEAHGTGTALGDPIEVEALRATYAEAGDSHRCGLGSVKTNIGHLEGAAGIAGLIKAVLALQHGVIPPHLHFQQLNPHISFAGTPFFIPTGCCEWPVDGPRYAAVSSFGFGGTNAHVVLGSAPAATPATSDPAGRPLHVLAVSAKTDTALIELAHRYRATLEQAGDWRDVCWTANAGRTHFHDRLAVVAESAAAARDQLGRAMAGETVPGVHWPGRRETGRPKVAFLFTGQGAQYVGMGRRLYETESTFRQSLDRCGDLLRPHLDRPLIEVLYPDGGASPLHETAYTQPALFALAFAVSELWRSWGVTPGAVLGHSVGEYAAACAAGVVSLEDGLQLAARRGKLMQALPPDGAMAVVFAGEPDVAEALGTEDAVSIAALNGPSETVVSGRRDRLERVLDRLHANGIQTRPLAVSHAFHSPLMDPVLEPLETAVAAAALAEPRLGFISNLTGRAIEPGVVTEPRYWRRHARQPVRFAAGIRTLHAQGYRVFVEIGPHPVLTALGQQCIDDPDTLWLPSLRRGADDWEPLLNSLARFYAAGGSVDWAKFDGSSSRRRVVLPTYPFERQQFRRSESPAAPRWADWLHEVRWQIGELPDVALDVAEPGRWLILADRSGTGNALAAALRSRGDECVLAFAGEGFAATAPWTWTIAADAGADFERLLVECVAVAAERVPLKGIVHLWSLDAPADAGDDAEVAQIVLHRCGSVLHLLQALVSAGTKARFGPPRVWIVTAGAQCEPAPDGVTQTPVWGLARVIASEHPEYRCTCVDVGAIGEGAARLLTRELVADDGEDQVAWRSGTRLVARLLPAAPTATQHDLPIAADKSYLVTGGLGALGLTVARWLVSRGARHLVLLGRRPPSPAAIDLLRECREAGVDVAVVRADAAQKDELAHALDVVRASSRPLAGVVHAAGVLDDGVLEEQSWERLARVLAPKVAGAWNLHQLTRDLPLDFLVFFSSMTSVFGTPGQSSYAAANAFLDGLAHLRRGRGLPALSINWGPWAAAGMAADDRQQEARDRFGIGAINPHDGTDVLGQLLGRETPQIGVFAIDWRRFLEPYEAGQVPPLLYELARRTGPRRHGGNRLALRARLEQASAASRLDLLMAHVCSRAVEVLGLARTYPLDARTPLRDLGIDSLLSIELAKALSADLGRPFPPTVVFTHPTVATIAAYLLPLLWPPVAGDIAPEPSIEPLGA